MGRVWSAGTVGAGWSWLVTYWLSRWSRVCGSAGKDGRPGGTWCSQVAAGPMIQETCGARGGPGAEVRGGGPAPGRGFHSRSPLCRASNRRAR